MRNVLPTNNWIHVRLQAEEEREEETLVFLPEDFKRAEKPYKAVEVVSGYDYQQGDTVIVPTHTIQDIEVDGETIYLVLHNHVMAFLVEEED
tara:strand:+ start:9377 stop:9652 length:276 start_codon:yes stop_codon:yes gene_type:complete